jgi:hypothetical protein
MAWFSQLQCIFARRLWPRPNAVRGLGYDFCTSAMAAFPHSHSHNIIVIPSKHTLSHFKVRRFAVRPRRIRFQ